MGDHLDQLKAYLRGTNPRISSAAAMVKTTPPGAGSRLVRVAERNLVYELLERRVGGVRLLVTGRFNDDDLGVACYHSKVGAVELLLREQVGADLLVCVEHSGVVRAMEQGRLGRPGRRRGGRGRPPPHPSVSPVAGQSQREQRPRSSRRWPVARKPVRAATTSATACRPPSTSGGAS